MACCAVSTTNHPHHCHGNRSPSHQVAGSRRESTVPGRYTDFQNSGQPVAMVESGIPGTGCLQARVSRKVRPSHLASCRIRAAHERPGQGGTVFHGFPPGARNTCAEDRSDQAGHGGSTPNWRATPTALLSPSSWNPDPVHAPQYQKFPRPGIDDRRFFAARDSRSESGCANMCSSSSCSSFRVPSGFNASNT